MDPPTYESLRNQTLLFFIEKLVDEQNKKRTLHDLSCQFGSRGFTREMRRIAGSSQSGLKKFLLEYPSLFEIKNDLVYYKDTSIKAAMTTDYNNDAVEYFRERMIQYGMGVWVPVRSLLGHRSQAPSEIRHVSGQTLEEFTNFLKLNENVFRLENENVLLIEFSEFKDLRKEDKVIELVEFYVGVLSNRGPLLIEQLFHISSTNQVAMESFKSPGDLKSFFQMHGECFEVTPPLITLTTTHKIGLEYLIKQKSSQKIKSEEIVVKVIPQIKPELKIQQIEPRKKDNTLKTRISNILLKTLETNNETKKTFCDNNLNFLNVLETQNDEEICRFLNAKTVLVSSVRRGKEILGKLSRESVIFVDLEGVNLGDGMVTLCQICCHDEVFIFDVLTMGGVIGEMRALFGGDCLKVFHDCRNDSYQLYNEHGLLLENVYDTMSAHYVVSGDKKNVSLNNLCELYGTGVWNPFKERVKTTRDPRYWSRRPLTKQMIAHASAEVLCLQHLYQKISILVKSEKLSLLKQLTEEQLLSNIQPEEIRTRRRMRKNEEDLGELKGKIEFSLSSDSSLVLSNREMRLLKHLELSPLAKEKLKTSLKIAKKLEKLERPQNLVDEENRWTSSEEPTSLEINRLENIESLLSDMEIGSFEQVVKVDVGCQTTSTGDVVVLGVVDC